MEFTLDYNDKQKCIKKLLQENPKGLTIDEISKKLSFNRGTVVKYLNILVASGHAELRILGRAKLFSLTQRIPLANILSLTSIPIMILDEDHFIRDMNDAFFRCFNIGMQDLKGSKIEFSPLAFYFNNDWLASLDEALDGKRQTLEVRVPGLMEKYFKVSFIPLVFDGGGKAAGVILEEISEMKAYQHNLESQVRERTTELENMNKLLLKEIEVRKKAEELQIQSEQTLLGIINFLPDATLAIDMSGKVIAWNRAIEEMTGISALEMIGKDNFEYSIPFYGVRIPTIIDMVLHPYPEIEQRYNSLRRNGESIIVESYFPQLHSGNGAYLRAVASPLYDLKGNVTGAIASIRDITEWKHLEDKFQQLNATLSETNEHLLARETIIREQYQKQKTRETALRESEKMYRTLFENTGTATVIIEDDMMISLANTTFETLSGYSRKEIEGKKSLKEFIGEQDLDRCINLHRLRRESRDITKNYEFHFINRAGKIHKILISVDLIPGTMKSVASLVDITGYVLKKDSNEGRNPPG